MNDINTLVKETKGYSGADLKNLFAEAALIPLREIKDITKIDASSIRGLHLVDFITAI